MSKTDELEAKIRQTVMLVASLRKENQQLRSEIDSTKSHLSLYNNENNKAQQILADYEQIRRKNEMVGQKVEKALATLQAMRGGT